MMHLSRLILNPCNRQVLVECKRPYQLHRTLLKAFPAGVVSIERKSDEAAGVLFRLEEDPCHNSPTILVQSKTAPEWDFLVDQRDARGQPYLLPAALVPDGKPNPAVTQFDMQEKLGSGQILVFRLRANPTKRLGKGAGKDHGKRVGIYEEEKQIEWLKRKAEAGGFRLLQVSIFNDGKLKDIIRRKNELDEKLELCAAQFDGMLEVVNAEKLVESVANGIGSGKGFGFGLLSLAPVR
jgi:CRISPR system Cascade subunit CasE